MSRSMEIVVMSRARRDALTQRIAQLEEALGLVCQDYQRGIDEMAAHGVYPSADAVAHFGTAPYQALKARDAAQRRAGAVWALKMWDDEQHSCGYVSVSELNQMALRIERGEVEVPDVNQ